MDTTKKLLGIVKTACATGFAIFLVVAGLTGIAKCSEPTPEEQTRFVRSSIEKQQNSYIVLCIDGVRYLQWGRHRSQAIAVKYNKNTKEIELCETE